LLAWLESLVRDSQAQPTAHSSRAVLAVLFAVHNQRRLELRMLALEELRERQHPAQHLAGMLHATPDYSRTEVESAASLLEPLERLFRRLYLFQSVWR
jgi:hypothetical protein